MSRPIHLLVLAAIVWGCGNGSGTAPNPSSEGANSGTGSGLSSEGGSAGAGGSGSSGGTTGAGDATGSGGSTGSGAATDAGAGDGSGDATGIDGGGMSGGALPGYFIGADITDQEPAPAAAITDLLSQMRAHGFNFVRLRTFVDPGAADGYDRTTAFDDIAHTVAFGKVIKDAGMGLLIDFHMSDNWADPGKQCVPVAWQVFTSITDLAKALHDYTKDAITRLIAGHARPDMVQIGNEITPGMLLHRCDASGKPTGNSPIQGAATAAGWPSLGVLLKAGVAGVKEVDTGILISLHIDRGNSFAASKSWIDSAIKQGVVFDAFGESCYQQFQGDANSTANTVNGWTTTFSQLATTYPNLEFFAAEYGPMEQQINDVVFNLPLNRGMGTFDWEPTSEGSWNAAQPSDPTGTTTHALLQRSGSTYTELPDLALYSRIRLDYASRL